MRSVPEPAALLRCPRLTSGRRHRTIRGPGFGVALIAGYAFLSQLAGAAPSLDALPAQLHAEGRHTGAAIEYRRLALDAADPAHGAGWFWMAADEYRHAADTVLAGAMANRAEDADPSLQRATALMRGELALLDRAWQEADFYVQASLPDGTDAASQSWRRYAARRSAVARMEAGNLAGARAALAGSPVAEPRASAALDAYAATPRKSPWIGGLLGLIPGLGYAYSGEYANGARSLILNGLFIFGMAKTAEQDQWGGFAVISFFELTWYSGSVYGGMDAAQRYNEARRAECGEQIMERAAFGADPAQLPLISLRFTF